MWGDVLEVAHSREGCNQFSLEKLHPSSQHGDVQDGDGQSKIGIFLDVKRIGVQE